MDALYEFGISLILYLQILSPALDGIMKAFTFLGRIEFYLILIPFIYWAVDRRIGARALLILIFTDFIAASFKLLFHEPRPYWIGEVKQLGTETSYGIPSSHASDSIAVFGYLAMQIKKNWLRIIIIIVIFFVGLSRLYLGVHFPQDVLFGWFIGLVVLWGFTVWEKPIRNLLVDKTLSTQVGVGFAVSILFIFIGFIIRFMVSGTPDHAEWSQYSTEARTVTQFITLAGATFGTWTGYALMRQYASFDAKGTWGKRTIRYIVGIIGLLVIYYGLSQIFDLFAVDESTLGYMLRYIRYGLVTFWATFLAPWIFIKLKLSEEEL